MVLAAARSQVDVLGSWAEGHVVFVVCLPLKTMLRSVALVDAGDHVDVLGPCCSQKPCSSPWTMFPLNIKGK